MTDAVRPLCAWTGVNPDGDEIVACDRRATSVVTDRKGHRVYTCDEHLASAKARAGSGALQTGVPHLRFRSHGLTEAPAVHTEVVGTEP